MAKENGKDFTGTFLNLGTSLYTAHAGEMLIRNAGIPSYDVPIKKTRCEYCGRSINIDKQEVCNGCGAPVV